MNRRTVPAVARPTVQHLLLAILLPLLAAPATAQVQWPQGAQQPDGRWAAADDGSPGDADLRVTAWMMLALVGDGSTLRQGPLKPQIKSAAVWLAAQQDRQGRFGLRSDPDWLLDHAIATCAYAETLRRSSYRSLADNLRRAVRALARQITVQRAAIDIELRLWCEWTAITVRCIESGRRIELLLADPQRSPAYARRPRIDRDPDLGSAELLRALADLPPAPPPDSPRSVAAQCLRDVLALRVPAADALPSCWPGDLLVDPLATFYATAAAWNIGGQCWRRASKELAQVTLNQEKQGQQRGSWNPIGDFGHTNGRAGASAVAMMTTEIWYRYSHLSL